MMKRQKVTDKEFEQIMAAEPRPADPSNTAAGSTVVQMLSTLDRKLLDQIMIEQRFEPGEIVFHEGHVGDVAYLIWSGRVAVVVGDFIDPTAVIYRGPGEVVGEMSLIDNKPRSASIVAIDEVRLLGLNRTDFFDLLQMNPDFSAKLLELLSTRLRAAETMTRVNTEIGRELGEELELLQSQNEALQKLQRRRQELSELIYHDLRNPLGNVYSALNMLEIVLPEDVLEANRELLEIAKLSYHRMQILVDSLLDLSRMETGQLDLDKEPVNIGDLIEEVTKLQLFSLQKRDIELIISASSDLPPVTIDTEQIQRVLTNLIDNALKYSPRNGKILVTAVQQEDVLQISVVDEGPGVPPADRERIFDRFAQVPTGGIRPKGFGLGLAYCKMAVEAHDGRIWVEPGPEGVGSRFTFTLPLSAQ